MTIAILFWILFIVGLIFGGYSNRDNIGGWATNSLLFWILLFLLGIGIFGGPIK
jgi:hypothetical protein